MHLDEDTTTQRWSCAFWRVKISLVLYIHHYPTTSDRWVFQPAFIYDCKPGGES